jgi:signal transduction histidine kinase
LKAGADDGKRSRDRPGRFASRGLGHALAFALVWALLVESHAESRVEGLAAPPSTQTSVRLSPGEQEWVKAHPEVRWGSDPDWPPFCSIGKGGTLEGIDSDITRLVASRVGLTLTPVTGSSWSEVFEKAKSGEVDFLSAMAVTAERLKMFTYTHEYAAFPVVIVTREQSSFLTSSRAVETMSLAQQRSYVVTDQLEKDFPGTRLVLTDTVEEALNLVARGKADASFQNLAVATRTVRLNGLTNLKISGVSHYVFPLRFAVRKDAPELVSILNKGLATITPHEAESIYAAHLTPDIAMARDWGAWRRRTVWVLGIGAFVAGALLLWNRSLSQEISRRKTAEAELVRARDRLADHASELQEANEDLKAFSTSASHDLRAPLRRLNSFAGLISIQKENQLTEKSRRWLSDIGEESRRMDQLISDLLLFARLGRAPLHKKEVDMVALVRETIEQFRPQSEGRNVFWNIGNIGHAAGDKGLLRLVFANLIDNALKYTRNSARPAIVIDKVLNQDGPPNSEDVFCVSDNGCGFDPAEAGSLFNPFHRLHQAEQYEGTGIGLANVKRIITKHHGRVWFESRPNEGAKFFFSLPASNVTASSTHDTRVIIE